MSHRQKPFSTKLKKQQLQQKRERIKAKQSRLTKDREETGSEEASEDPHEGSASIPVKLDAVRGHVKSIVSVFAKLSEKEIAARKHESQKPFQRLDPSALEVGFEDLWPGPSSLIPFPERPPWSVQDSKEQLEAREQAMFDKWLEGVYAMHGSQELSFFEHNLDVWRQLWRVVEISDIVLFVVDSRHPVVHFPPTLFDYVVIKMKKKLVLVFNKIDLIDAPTLIAWRSYFETRFPGLHTASFSIYPPETFLEENGIVSGAENGPGLVASRKRIARSTKRYVRSVGVAQVLCACKDVKVVNSKGVFVDWDAMIEAEEEKQAKAADSQLCDGGVQARECGTVLNRSDLQRHKREAFLSDDDSDSESECRENDNERVENETSSDEETGEVARGLEGGRLEMSGNEAWDVKTDMITIGLIGHPNVGKSSLINGIMGKKVVSTSATPGHTKHFQTIHLNKIIRLCDCPGLVFPAVIPKAVQILSGMYKIAQVQEPYSVVQYLAERIPVEKVLGLVPPADDEEPNTRQHQKFMKRQDRLSRMANWKLEYPWSAWKICEAYAIQRGFLTPHAARPDVYRAANLILRMANDGRLLLGFKPPGYFATLGASTEEKQREDVGSEYTRSGAIPRSNQDCGKVRSRPNEDDKSEEEEGTGYGGVFGVTKEVASSRLGNAFALLSVDE